MTVLCYIDLYSHFFIFSIPSFSSLFLFQHHGESRHIGEWEWTNFAVISGCILIGAAYLYRADSNPNSWARDEAEARRRRRLEGKEVIFGVNYSGIELLKKSGAVTESEAEELEAGKIINSDMTLASNKAT